MIKLFVEEGKVEIRGEGSPSTIFAELAMGINAIYCELDDKHAAEFKKAFTCAVKDGILFSKTPGDMLKACTKSVKKMDDEEDAPAALDKLVKDLNELLEALKEE